MTMGKKTPEAQLKEIERLIGRGYTVAAACKKVGISRQGFYTGKARRKYFPVRTVKAYRKYAYYIHVGREMMEALGFTEDVVEMKIVQGVDCFLVIPQKPKAEPAVNENPAEESGPGK